MASAAQKQPEKITTSEPVDALIVGSGASGSLMAAKLAQAGKRVLILESGPERTLADMTSSLIHARNLKWGGAFVEEEGNHKITNNYNSGWGTGGGTAHHFAVWPRLHPVDFEQRSRYDEGLDWPISYNELQPYYDRIQKEVGVSGNAKLETWRPAGEDYPMRSLPVFSQGHQIAKGFAAIGKTTAPIPLAINSQTYNNRRPCIYDGWCEAGCPIGALANSLTTYLPVALANGTVIKHRATVTRVLTDATGKRAIGVTYRDAQGEEHTQYANTVVLAAFVVQNARLLLASANNKHPEGLANRNGLVGRYLMSHPAGSVFGLFPESTQPHLGVTGGQLINQDAYDDKTAIKDAFGGYQWLIANAVKPNDLLGIANSRPDVYGAALETFMRKATTNIGTMVFVADDLPLAENRVILSSNTDNYGVPLARAIHNLDSRTERLAAAAFADGERIFKAAGVTDYWQGPRVAMHLMGGTVMGNNSSDSVTNSYGQTHEIANLFIAGPGLFPTSGAVNPTFTIHALALRSAEYLAENWSSLSNESKAR